MQKLVASIALASALGLSLTACGGGGSKADDPTSKNAKTTLAATFAKDAAKEGSDNPITAASSSCVANGIVDKVGVAKLTEYKVIDAQGNAIEGSMDSLKASKEDATTIVDTIFGCVGDDDLMNSMMKSMDSDGKMPDSVKECVKAVFTKDTIRTVLIASLQGKDSAEAKAAITPFSNKLMACAMQGMGSTH